MTVVFLTSAINQLALMGVAIGLSLHCNLLSSHLDMRARRPTELPAGQILRLNQLRAQVRQL